MDGFGLGCCEERKVGGAVRGVVSAETVAHTAHNSVVDYVSGIRTGKRYDVMDVTYSLLVTSGVPKA